MITRKTRRGIIALLMLTVVSFWISRSQDEAPPQPVAGLDPKLDYVLRDFELQIFDENGLPTMNLQAPSLRNNPKLQLGTIERPVIRLNQPGLTWDFTSDSATITADKEHIQLFGQVHVQRNESATGNWVKLNTSEIHIEVSPQTASTTQPVNMFDGLNHLDAIGMDLDMKNSNVLLKQQVKAIYAVN